ncbi:MAG TPA: substrate-binding domain-containing protein, partial [Mesotoga sp.]|nr:substrate-binding domain-containing protein [Mesotoga sp.]
MKSFGTVFVLLMLVGTAFGSTLVIKGSNTVYPVAQLWAEAYKEINPDAEISIEGAGSSTGIKALFNGQADIANSSRWI